MAQQPSNTRRPASPQPPAGTSRPAGASRPSGAPRPSPRSAWGQSPYARWAIRGGLVLLALALGFFLQFCLFPDGKLLGIARQEREVVQIMSGSALRVNEIMSANKTALLDENGGTPDWIEIINHGSGPLNLEGYTLARESNANARFAFPALRLDPGECALVFADSRYRNAPDGELHAPFRLSSSGDTLLLFNPTGTAIDSVNIPALGQDEVYRRGANGGWERSGEYTPGLANTSANFESLRTVRLESPVRITEICASNASLAPDENGLYHDYIELYNASSETVSLRGWRLSDDRGNTAKWQFPAAELGAGQYMLIYASGVDGQDADGRLHTSYKLSSAGESAVLANAKGQLLDAVDFPALDADQAWSLRADGSWTADLKPTPGAANE